MGHPRFPVNVADLVCLEMGLSVWIGANRSTATQILCVYHVLFIMCCLSCVVSIHFSLTDLQKIEFSRFDVYHVLFLCIQLDNIPTYNSKEQLVQDLKLGKLARKLFVSNLNVFYSSIGRSPVSPFD